jgi:multicomponent Na+:H+ antiporter subunit D
MRYLAIQVSSGLLLLAGALLHYNETGSLVFDYIGLEGLDGFANLGGLLIFLAFGIKCAFPFLHNWLTDAYPEATPTGTVFLSAFTTKVAVYALARGFPGTEILIYIGAVMTCFPIFFAVIENDLRRVLAYSMINQIGFMVCGIGVGTALALNGAVAHAFNDVSIQGTAVHEHGRCTVSYRHYQWLRPRRPVQVHAENGNPVYRRRLFDIGVPAVQRIRQQVDGDGCHDRGRL